MNNFKRILTDIIAYITVIAGVAILALEDIPDNAEWYVVVGFTLFAIVSYLIGRNGNGTK